MKNLAIVLLVLVTPACLPPDGAAADPDGGTAQAAAPITGPVLSSWPQGVVEITRTGSSGRWAAIMVSRTAVLTTKSLFPAGTSPASIQLRAFNGTSYETRAAVRLVPHPTLDIVLIEPVAAFTVAAGSGYGDAAIVPAGPATFETRDGAALFGQTLHCYGFDATGLRMSTVRVSSATADGFIVVDTVQGPYYPDAGPGQPPSNPDLGSPCLSSSGLAGVSVRTDPRSPEVELGASQLSEWAHDQAYLIEVRRLGAPARAIYMVPDAAHPARTLCLDIPSGTSANGIPINQYDCNGGLNQAWYTDPRVSASFPPLVSAATGKCIDVPGGSFVRIGLQEYTCHGGLDQGWQLAPQYLLNPFGVDGYQVVQRYSNRCLTANGSGAAFATGLQVVQDTCPSAAAPTAQHWYTR